jgi:cytoskeletal protein CcmA (bactofilin family)
MTTIQIRRGTASEWDTAQTTLSTTPVLGAGEFGLETDTMLLKVGDGTNIWGDLEYLNGQQNTLCYNGTGSTIPKGSVVYISGAQGANPSISLADADAESTSSKALGITTKAITTGNTGPVGVFGRVMGVNTSGFTAGDALWLSSTSGGITNVKPTQPAHQVFIGYCIKVGTSGSVFVNPQNGYELDELHDVLITSKTNNDLLTYESSSGLWKNKSFSTLGLVTSSSLATSTTAGIVELFSDTVQSVAANTVSSTASRTYGIQVNSSGQAVVNVPWTDTNSGGTVTTVSVATGNGFAGTVATATSTPAITLTTSVTGLLKGNGTAMSAAVAGTDYLAPPSGTSLLKANSGGALANATASDVTTLINASNITTSGTLSTTNTTASTSTSTGSIVASGGIGVSGNAYIGGDVVITGNVTINGTTSTLNSTTITVDDKNLELGSVTTPTDITADGGGVTLKGATDKTFNWVSSTSSWTSSENLDLASGKVIKVAGTQILSATQYTGNAATVTNGVYTSGSYSDPSWLTLSKSKVGLGNVDNTSDANKPISTATQTALDLKVDEPIEIGAVSVDLNSYTTAGLYHQSLNIWSGGASGGTNYPVSGGAAGMLTVWTTSGSMVYQMYQTYGSSNRMFFRALYNSAWSSWKEIVTSSFSNTLSLTNTTDMSALGTASVVLSGGLSVAKKMVVGDVIYIGSAATSVAFTAPSIIAKNSGAAYAQIAMINSSSTGSADFAAYGDDGDETSGWSDLGFTGSAFSDTNYTITGKNDGYLFAQGKDVAGRTGNLVLATGARGTNLTSDIVFATGGFLAANERMRFVAGTGLTDSQLWIKSTTTSTSTSTGALRVAGGAGIAGALYAGGNISTAGALVSTASSGAPITVTSTTQVANLTSNYSVRSAIYSTTVPTTPSSSNMVKIYVSTTAPTDMGTGDVWISF